MDPSLPKDIRVPLNTHPSRRPPNYGADHTAALDLQDSIEDSFHTCNISQPSSFRDSIGSFVGSYSRASVLYVAENLTLHPSHNSNDMDHCDLEEDYDVSKQGQAGNLSRTLSGQTTTGYHLFPALSRHTTVASILSEQLNPTGHSASHVPQSNFLQSVFNSVNVLIGIGMLALPLSFRYAGWFWGTIIFFFCSFLTNYTAKLLGQCLEANPGSATYGDMGAAAFGDKGRRFVSTIFITELLTACVAMIVLLGDGIQSLWPNMELITTRIISFTILTPMMFLPIRKLAYTSLIGIISCVSLVLIVVYDGLTKEAQPGSLLDPMPTELFPSQVYNVPLAFGIMMAGFAGHAVFPAIHHDMKEKKDYDQMVNLTYIVALLVYAVLAMAGYAMFGLDTMQEITQNLALTPGYNKILNRAAIWLVVMTPVAKYGLMMNPVTLTWELWLINHPSIENWCKYHAWRETFLVASSRICISALVIYTATVFPGFDRVMSLLGSLFSFSISAIFPLVCYKRLFGHSMTKTSSAINNTLLAVSIVMASLGTLWTFLPSPN
ncbi:transmembrane amino acid transporter protein-domain-containing protein [Phycomyces nitens]|nr:transmembrane amino acid transporter protein-domain-containing protein [Phycomyces nitens]